MKHKYLLFGLALVSMLGGLSSCKKNTDVTSTCKSIAEKSFVGETSIRSGSCADDDLSFNAVQYQFQAGKKATRSVLNWGNKKALSVESVECTYTTGEFGENGFGIEFFFTPTDGKMAPFTAVYVNNAITEKGTGLQYALGNVDDKITAMTSIDANFKDFACEYFNKEYWTEKVKYNDTTFSKKVIIVEGKKVVVVDTLITQRERIDTLGQKIYEYDFFVFERNASTLENTGVYQRIYQEWDESLVQIADIDEGYNFVWGIGAVSSAKKFDVLIKNAETGDWWTAAVSKFDKAKESIVIDGNAYTFVAPN